MRCTRNDHVTCAASGFWCTLTRGSLQDTGDPRLIPTPCWAASMFAGAGVYE